MSQLISIILPVYNQADHLRQIVEEYQGVMARVETPHEFVLVVNGCRDNSLDIAQELASETQTVRVAFSEQGGWGLAVKLGIQHAQGDLICYTNSARTGPQDLQLLLLYAVANPGTVIKANRKIRDNWQRRLGSLLYNIQVRTLFDLAYWDVNGTPKVFPREFEALLTMTRDDDLIDAEFNAICRWEGYPMLEVPIFSTKRHGGRSTTSYQSALKMYTGAVSLWRDMQREARTP
jgi:glycosyltransferase involved in cell wall biosynthesis